MCLNRALQQIDEPPELCICTTLLKIRLNCQSINENKSCLVSQAVDYVYECSSVLMKVAVVCCNLCFLSYLWVCDNRIFPNIVTSSRSQLVYLSLVVLAVAWCQ